MSRQRTLFKRLLLRSSVTAALFGCAWTLAPSHMFSPDASLVARVSAQDGWDVSNDSGRRQEILRRYKQLVESNPVEGLAYKKMIEYAGGASGVAALIAEYEKKVEKDPDTLKYWLILGHLRKTATDYEDAIKAYDKALELDDKSAPGYLGRGQARMMLQLNVEATSDFEQALALESGKEGKQEILRKLADLSFAQRDWDKAQEYYDRLIELDPRSEYLRMEYAQVLVKYKRYEKALEQYEALLKLSGRDVKARATALRDMGELYELMGDYDKALETYKKAQSYVTVSNWLYREVEQRIIGVYRRMDKLLEYAEEREKNWSRPSYDQAMLLANLFDEIGREEKAFDYYKLAIKKSGRSVDPRFKVIQILQRRGDVVGVIKAYEELIRVAPSEARYQFDLAKIHYRNGDQERALKLLKNIERKFGRQSEVMVKLADMYMRFGNNDKALAVYKGLVKRSPRNEMYILGLGEYYYQSGDTTQAIKIWETLLKSDLPKAQAHAQFGLVLVDHGMIERGIEQYEEAAKLMPEDQDVQRGLAMAYEMGRYWERAIDVWTELMRGEPDSPVVGEARSRIVALYKRQNKLRSKITEFKEKFESTPPDVEAGYFLAEAYGKIGEHDRAEIVWQKIIDLDGKLDKDDIGALQALEKAYTFRGETQKAIGVLQKLAEVRPARAREYYQRIAELSLKNYNDDQAVEYAQLALQKNPDDAMAHAKLGDVYAKMQRVDDAIKSYRDSLDLDPRNFEVYFKLSQLLMEKGEVEEAYKLYLYVAKKATDEVQVAQSARRLIALAQNDDELLLLEQELAPEVFNSSGLSSAYRRVLIEIYGRLAGVAVARRNAGATLTQEELDRLRIVGNRAFPVLMDALQSEELGQRQQAIRMLAEFDLKNASGALARLATDDKEPLRLNALGAVAMLGSSDAASIIDDLVDNENIAVRQAATWGLGALDSDTSIKTLERLVEQESVDFNQKALAALSLGRIGGKQAEKVLLRALEDVQEQGYSDDYGLAVVLGLGLSGSAQSVTPLEKVLSHPNPNMATAAAWALGQIDDGSAAAALLDAYWSGDKKLRERARDGLNWFADAGQLESIRPGYTRMLAESRVINEREKDPARQFESALIFDMLEQGYAYAPMSRPDRFFVSYEDVLSKIVSEKSAGKEEERKALWNDLMREDVALGLGIVSGEGVDQSRKRLIQAIRPQLLASLAPEREGWEERRAALVMLGMLANKEDLATIREHYRDERAIVRREAIRALGFGFVQSAPDEITNVLLQALVKDDSPDVRAQAASVLSLASLSVQSRADVERALIAGLDDRALVVQVQSARALGDLGLQGATDALVANIGGLEGDDALYARLYALAKLDTPAAREVLDRYRESGDLRVRQAIAAGSGK